MSDFDKRFEETRKKFDRDFKAIERWSMAISVVGIIAMVILLAFAIWAAVMFMKFYGVI